MFLKLIEESRRKYKTVICRKFVGRDLDHILITERLDKSPHFPNFRTSLLSKYLAPAEMYFLYCFDPYKNFKTTLIPIKLFNSNLH